MLFASVILRHGANGVHTCRAAFKYSFVAGAPDFEKYITTLLERKADASAALKELDGRLALLQNHIPSLSLYVKQNHLVSKTDSRAETVAYYTKQEVANIFRVSMRTVTNWVVDRLETEEVGGIKRISADALNSFQLSSKQKMCGWRSIARHSS